MFPCPAGMSLDELPSLLEEACDRYGVEASNLIVFDDLHTVRSNVLAIVNSVVSLLCLEELLFVRAGSASGQATVPSADVRSCIANLQDHIASTSTLRSSMRSNRPTCKSGFRDDDLAASSLRSEAPPYVAVSASRGHIDSDRLMKARNDLAKSKMAQSLEGQKQQGQDHMACTAAFMQLAHPLS